jgi:hypothetical protein
MQQQLVQLARLHDALASEWVRRCERKHAPGWWTRNGIWNDAFEVICERSDDPLRPDTKMQSRLTEQVSGLLADPDYDIPGRGTIASAPLLAGGVGEQVADNVLMD